MKKLVLIFSTLIFFFLIICFSTYRHEQVHRAVFSYDGCKDASVHMNYVGASYTSCVSENYSESSTAALLHGENEVVGYNMDTIILCALIICLTIILTSKMEE